MLNLKNLFRPPETKTSRTAQVLAFESGGRARWSPRDYAALAREGYLANAVVHRAVRMIAENAASCAFLLYEGAQERDDHPLLQLLTRPNARQDGASFFEALYAHMLLAGNAYVEAVALDDQVRELYALRPDRMKVVPGSDGWAEAYDYSVGGRSVRFDQAASGVPPILHLTFFHPLDDHYGLAPVEAAAVAIDAAVQIGVLDTALTEPPPSPTESARYIVAAGATGDWADHVDAIAAYEDATWRFLVPKLGWSAWSAADEIIFVFDGAAWRDLRDLPVAIDSTARVGVNTSASDPNLLTVHSNAALFYAIAAADGGSGDARLQISKEGEENTASVVFSDDFSGRAEFGLVESNAFKLKVSDDGSSFVEALAIDQATGNTTLPRGVALTGVIAPPQLTADQDDYAPAGIAAAAVIRLSADAVRSVTGLSGGSEGRVMCVINAGAFAVVLRGEGAGSSATNRFGFGDDLTLAAQQGVLLIYDGNAARWRQAGGVPGISGDGGGTGATDSERQNTLLTLAYQSKACAEYRRLVNLFATGFAGANDTANGIDAGSSGNYTVTPTSGIVAPSVTPGSDQIPSMTGGTTSGVTISATGQDGSQFPYLAGDKANSTYWQYTGTTGDWSVDFGSALTIASVTMRARSDTGVAVPRGFVVQGSLTGAWTGEEVALSTQAGLSWTAAETKTFTIGAPGAYRYYRIHVTQNGSSGVNMGFSEVTMLSGSTASAMTLVTAAQTADSPVGYARVLLEYDNTAMPALNADLTVEVTCDGGAHWANATLSAVTSYSQGGRAVAETADTACTPGTSFAARIKELNGKGAPIYVLTVQVH